MSRGLWVVDAASEMTLDTQGYYFLISIDKILLLLLFLKNIYKLSGFKKMGNFGASHLFFIPNQ